jgi:hypothetical protein
MFMDANTTPEDLAEADCLGALRNYYTIVPSNVSYTCTMEPRRMIDYVLVHESLREIVVSCEATFARPFKPHAALELRLRDRKSKAWHWEIQRPKCFNKVAEKYDKPLEEGETTATEGSNEEEDRKDREISWEDAGKVLSNLKENKTQGVEFPRSVLSKGAPWEDRAEDLSKAYKEWSDTAVVVHAMSKGIPAEAKELPTLLGRGRGAKRIKVENMKARSEDFGSELGDGGSPILVRIWAGAANFWENGWSSASHTTAARVLTRLLDNRGKKGDKDSAVFEKDGCRKGKLEIKDHAHCGRRANGELPRVGQGGQESG